MKSLLRVLNGESLPVPPMWLMRQAGRYLPEYRDLRVRAGSFLNLVYTPKLAVEVTMQPIRRYGFDAAILFSDILVVSHALGADLKFVEGEGPQLSPVTQTTELKKLNLAGASTVWAPVMEAVTGIKAQLVQEGFVDTSLIGFAGAPWTIACYMICGNGYDHDFGLAKDRAYRDPKFFDALIDMITQATIDYLSAQIRAGAEVIQIFDSWAGAASGDLFDRYVMAPTAKIVSVLRQEFPDIPIIGFPRLCGNRLGEYARATGVQGVSVDSITDLGQAGRDLPSRVAIQGNLDPMLLVAGGSALDDYVDRIISSMRERPFIFNLGHGILPVTPVDHVTQLVACVRKGK